MSLRFTVEKFCDSGVLKKSLGFRVGKFRDSGPLYNSFSISPKNRRMPLRKKMSLRFRVRNFAIAASLRLALRCVSPFNKL